MKSILRSKSPSIGEQPKSILKRHSPDVNEMEPMSSPSSSSSSEEFVVAAENNLAAQLLNVELESKNQPSPTSAPVETLVQLPPSSETAAVISNTDTAVSLEDIPTTEPKQQQQHQVDTTQSSQSVATTQSSSVVRET